MSRATRAMNELRSANKAKALCQPSETPLRVHPYLSQRCRCGAYTLVFRRGCLWSRSVHSDSVQICSRPTLASVRSCLHRGDSGRDRKGQYRQLCNDRWHITQQDEDAEREHSRANHQPSDPCPKHSRGQRCHTETGKGEQDECGRDLPQGRGP